MAGLNVGGGRPGDADELHPNRFSFVYGRPPGEILDDDLPTANSIKANVAASRSSLSPIVVAYDFASESQIARIHGSVTGVRPIVHDRELAYLVRVAHDSHLRVKSFIIPNREILPSAGDTFMASITRQPIQSYGIEGFMPLESRLVPTEVTFRSGDRTQIFSNSTELSKHIGDPAVKYESH